MQKALLIITIFSFIHCKQHSNSHTDGTINNTIKLRVLLRPSWAEHSIIEVTKTDSSQTFSILLQNNFRARLSNDTFYYFKQSISDRSWSLLESSIMSKINETYVETNRAVVDGFYFNIVYYKKSDTSYISLTSPVPKDTFHYSLCNSILNNFKIVNTDALVNNYFEDIMPYLDTAFMHSNDYDKLLFKLREQKYNWKYHR
jgi:hypothetical protein